MGILIYKEVDDIKGAINTDTIKGIFKANSFRESKFKSEIHLMDGAIYLAKEESNALIDRWESIVSGAMLEIDHPTFGKAFVEMPLDGKVSELLSREG